MNIPKEMTEHNARQATFQGLTYFNKPLTECTNEELIAAVYVNAYHKWLNRPLEQLLDDGTVAPVRYANSDITSNAKTVDELEQDFIKYEKSKRISE